MAGALSRRDIEMIFRAETDKATRPIADLGKAVKTTRGLLADLVEEAGKGEVSLDKLGSATRDLKKAQDELGTARSLLTQLNSQEKALESAETKADAAAKKYADLKAAVDGAEAPTKKLVSSMEAAGRASAAAAERLDTVRAEAAQTREQIEAIIGPVNNVSTSFREVAQVGQEIARGLAVAGAAADDFKQKISAAATANAAAEAKLNADVGFEQAGRQAGLLQSQIDYLSQFENRVELLAQAKRELQSQDAAFEKAVSAQEAKVGAANVAALRQQIEGTFAEAARIERVAAFQQIAADAKAAVSDVSRFAVSEDAATASVNRFANAIQAILSPNAAAQRTIDSITVSVNNAATALEGRGTKSAEEYGRALNELQSAAAGIGAIASKIDGFKAQEEAVARARREFEAAKADALALATALETPGEDAEELARKLTAAQTRVDSTGEAMQRQAQKAAELAAALKRAGVDVNNLAGAEERLAEQARNAAAAQDGIQGKLGGKGGFLGLNVQDATNLSYQLNDIFTQLASGQSIFITLAQQGPQIWQIGGVKAWLAQMGPVLGVLGGLAAGFGAVALAAAGVYKATSPNAETQAAQAYLAMLGEKADISATQMGRLSNELQNYGAKAADANKIAQEFAQAGLNPEVLDTYALAVANAAQVTGNDMTDASDKLTAAMTGGYDAIVALNEAYPVLSDAELQQISNMIDAGKADEARQIVFDRFTGKMQDAADKMNGGWTQAWRNMKGAAEDFGNYIGGVMGRVLTKLRGWLDDAGVDVNYLLLRLRGLDAQAAGNAAVNNGGRMPAPKPTKPVTGDPNRTTAGGQRAIQEAERELDVRKRLTAAQRKENAAIEARRQALDKGYSPAEANRLAALASAKEGRAIADEQAKAGARAAKKAQSARDKAAREAETLANKINSQAEQLQGALDTMGAKVAKVAAGSLQDQLTNAATAVNKEYDKLYRQLEAFAQLTGGKGKIGNQTIEQYRAQLDANKAILTQQSQLKVYEDNLNDTLSERKQLLADIEDRAQRGEITSGEAIRQTAEVTSRYDPIIQSLTQAAINFAKSIGGATPSQELKAFIAKMERAGSANGGDDQEAVRKSVSANIGREESKLNQILSERNSLVESYNTLAQLGIITQQDARRKSAEAYNASKAQIDQQLATLRQTIETARQLGAITPQAYDAWIAKMQVVGAQADYLDPRFAQLKQGIDNIITQNAVDGITNIAQAFGNAIAGAESWGDALLDAGRALLDFIAKTTQMVAQLILQAIILDAVDKATGGFVSGILAFMKVMGGSGGGGPMGMKHNGGTIGSYAGGQQRTTRLSSISPAAIAAAPRYHDGTPSVGLKRDEQVAVLQTGEKVLTEKQQRDEARAKAQAGGNGRGLRQVLAFGDDQVAAAMQGPAGEDVTITHLRRNVPLLKQMLQD